MNHKMNIMMLLFLLALGLSQIIDLTSQYGSFDQFKVNFGKGYSSLEVENYRKDVFMNNLAKIASINSDSSNTYTAGVNQFSDMSDTQFAAKFLNLKVPACNLQINNNYDVPYNIDWIFKGRVTAVKDMGFCGSSWAFASIAAIESSLMINKFVLTPDLSEQEMMDCAVTNGGCSEGWMGIGLQYAKTYGISSEDQYPNIDSPQACQNQLASFKVTEVKEATGCPALVTALGRSPVTVAVDARTWTFYRNGILNKCGSTPNFGALLVGVTMQYWKIKNAWGTSWGENGYIRLIGGNTCGLCKNPTYPVV